MESKYRKFIELHGKSGTSSLFFRVRGRKGWGSKCNCWQEVLWVTRGSPSLTPPHHPCFHVLTGSSWGTNSVLKITQVLRRMEWPRSWKWLGASAKERKEISRGSLNWPLEINLETQITSAYNSLIRSGHAMASSQRRLRKYNPSLSPEEEE